MQRKALAPLQLTADNEQKQRLRSDRGALTADRLLLTKFMILISGFYRWLSTQLYVVGVIEAQELGLAVGAG